MVKSTILALLIMALIPTGPAEQSVPPMRIPGSGTTTPDGPTIDGTSALDSDGRATQRHADVRVHFASSGDRSTVRWALERFAEAGLELPALAIVVHQDPAPCEGNRGLYVRGKGRDRIELCDTTMPIVLHELAHAWEANSVNDGTRTLFLEFFGLTSWSSPSIRWVDRGIERAAQTIAFGLAPRPLDAYGASLHVDLLAAFELLSGRRSPRITSSTDD